MPKSTELDRALSARWISHRDLLNRVLEPIWSDDTLRYHVRRAAGMRNVVIDPGSASMTESDADDFLAADGLPDDVVRSLDGKTDAFVRDHDLWLRDVADGVERRITADGEPWFDYGSEPDYTRAHEKGRGGWAPSVLWANDSSKLVTHRLDQRQVLPLHLVHGVPDEGVRPTLTTFRCAFPGDEHVPLATLIIVDVRTDSVILVDGEPLVNRGYSSIDKGNVWWSADGSALYSIAEDRDHRRVRLRRTDAAKGETALVLEESADSYIDLSPDRTPPVARTLSTGEIVWYSERDGWAHLYLYASNGTLIRQLTSGAWRVNWIEHIDEDDRSIVVSASGREPDRDPYDQAIYRVPLDGGSIQPLATEPGFHEILFDPSGRWMLDDVSSVASPPVSQLRDRDGQEVMVLERADLGHLVDANWRLPERHLVLAADEETRIAVNLYLPADLNEHHRYPIVEIHYPGPQSIDAPPWFHVNAQAHALTTLGFVVVRIDGRGKMGRSKEFHDFQYAGAFGQAGGLGDSVAAITNLAAKRPWMDVSRVGIWGYSGGGYSAVRALIEHPDMYSVAVAGSGNHNQMTTIARWGERYIGMPGTSDGVEQGYADGDNAANVAAIRGHLFLYHGEIDDDVPPCNTMRLADALIRADKDFDMLIVPGRTHDDAGGGYVERKVWRFLCRHLRGIEI